ncbi:MAG: hypothetical protein IK143_08195 [Bacteroidales bacterium]|nr:hypothetical protein [Bacteroidales bacterium]
MTQDNKEILDGLKDAIESLRRQISELETRVEAFSQALEEPEVVEEPEIVEETVEEPLAVDIDADIQIEDIPVDIEVGDAPVEVTPLEENVFDFQDTPAAPRKDKKERRPSAGGYKWRTDLPGVQVKNIRSGISLYDRALYINSLFREDFALYDTTIGHLNELGSLDDAVEYLSAQFADWDFGSEVVYSFMMSLRKKFR